MPISIIVHDYHINEGQFLPVQKMIFDMQDMTSTPSRKSCRLVVAFVPVHCKVHPAGSYQSFPVDKVVVLALKIYKVTITP